MAQVQGKTTSRAWTLACVLAATPTVAITDDDAAHHPAYTLSLSTDAGKLTSVYTAAAGKLTSVDTAALYEKAVQIVRSSNDNSGDPRWRKEWGLVSILAEYRRSAAGKHLLISYKEAQEIQTVGGVTMVQEILIGLGSPYRADPLHTVDNEGRVIAHTMYSGELCNELAELVSRINDT